jgi:hypothetical protein
LPLAGTSATICLNCKQQGGSIARRYVNGACGQRIGAEYAVCLTHTVIELYDFLKAARKLYAAFGYHGPLHGSMRLERAQGREVLAAVPPGYEAFRSNLRTLPFDTYPWAIETDTQQLAEHEHRLVLLLDLMEQVHWDLRAAGYTPELLLALLKQTGRTQLPVSV